MRKISLLLLGLLLAFAALAQGNVKMVTGTKSHPARYGHVVQMSEPTTAIFLDIAAAHVPTAINQKTPWPIP